jgi:hypothetical protein
VCVCDTQDGATAAILASKAGHQELAALIASGGRPAAQGTGTGAAPAPATHLDPVYYSSQQVQVHVCPCKLLQLVT